jgi:general secretion pathway protein I
MAERSDAGFSLIEALVALVVLAVSAVSLLAATEAHVARIAGLEARALAQFAAENRMAEIELGVVGNNGPVLLLGQSFDIQENRSPTSDPDLERIDLRVTDRAGEKSYGGFFGFVAKRPEA